MNDHSVFWDDLAEDLDDPEFLREYVSESVRIATVDAVVNALDDARIAAGLTKAELARAISAEPASVRRLLASPNPNPTLGTLAELAAALGMKVMLQPLTSDERMLVTEPLLHGETADKKALIAHLERMRSRQERPAAAS